MADVIVCGTLCRDTWSNPVEKLLRNRDYAYSGVRHATSINLSHAISVAWVPHGTMEIDNGITFIQFMIPGHPTSWSLAVDMWDVRRVLQAFRLDTEHFEQFELAYTKALNAFNKELEATQEGGTGAAAETTPAT